MFKYMGPIVTAKTDPHTASRPLPADLAEVSLLDTRDICAAVRMSASWWHEEVRAGRAPQPVVRMSRCTRWKATDIRQYLIERARLASDEATAALTARAKKASDAAKAKRVTAVAS